ncbi:glycerophosphodiester phosphodiesterase family protein [Dysgonomonas sp. ZJ709]|uniref:glycerophosphodiester phosphodiesterase family protein n=1 Tax=Dysgonomonas sp. ZJ709 TaxID=2709797 RepID=UPI0013EE17CD|nr:glycerophosphodiester phosphodiesterase family protein [Dysgonomonas sp. ZJ709]
MKDILIRYLIVFLLFTFSSCGSDPQEGEDTQALSVNIELSNSYPATGEIVELNVIATAGILTSVECNWGDGIITQESKPAHQYSQNGTFTVTIKATGNNGNPVTQTKTVKVEGIGLTKSIKDFDHSKLWIMSHRGNTANDRIPENSMAAIETCLSNLESIDMIEVDPRLTKDGVMVLMHDETVNRTTNGTGKVSDLNYDQIKQLNLKLADGTVTEHTVPTLQDVMLKVRGKVFLNLDFIDKVSPKEIYELVRNNGMLDRVLFTVGTKKDVLVNMLGYNRTIHILGQHSDDGDDDFLSTAGGGNRINFAYVTPTKALNTGYIPLLYTKGFIPSTNMLNQGGYSYDAQMMKGDYAGVDLIIAKKALFIQTDNAPVLHAYLKSKGKR